MQWILGYGGPKDKWLCPPNVGKRSSDQSKWNDELSECGSQVGVNYFSHEMKLNFPHEALLPVFLCSGSSRMKRRTNGVLLCCLWPINWQRVWRTDSASCRSVLGLQSSVNGLQACCSFSNRLCFLCLIQEVFNQSFDSALQSLISDFLSRIEQLFPVPDFKQVLSDLSVIFVVFCLFVSCFKCAVWFCPLVPIMLCGM